MGIFDKILKSGYPLVEDTEETVDIQEQRIKGKIIQIDQRGFGFISSDELPFERIYFHWTSLKQETLRFPKLKLGMTVSFSARTQTPVEKGYKAIRILVE